MSEQKNEEDEMYINVDRFNSKRKVDTSLALKLLHAAQCESIGGIDISEWFGTDQSRNKKKGVVDDAFKGCLMKRRVCDDEELEIIMDVATKLSNLKQKLGTRDGQAGITREFDEIFSADLKSGHKKEWGQMTHFIYHYFVNSYLKKHDENKKIAFWWGDFDASNQRVFARYVNDLNI